MQFKIRDRDLVLVQIGAGAGDLDPRVDYIDGFTNTIKERIDKNIINQIYLIEPNPVNIEKLTECWKEYPATIIQGAITDGESGQTVKLFYCEEDAPHYQVASLEESHVRRIYPEAEIKFISVETININDFLSKIFEKHPFIDLLCLDIEGLDAKIVATIEWNKFRILSATIEHLHLREKTYSTIDIMRSNGYNLYGKSLDHFGHDWFFTKFDY